MINEWSLAAGCPAASLHERLSAEAPGTAGLLLYTATRDSAGSLGDLVARGDPGPLADTLRSAIHRAE